MIPISETRRLGVFGGTFDPIHRGHVEVADECAEKLDLDRVLMIPSNLPPHRGTPLASAQDRLAMVRLAVKGHSRLVASDIEVLRGGVSYTVDTIRILAEENPGVDLTLLLGWDAAEEFSDWRDSAQITRRARIAVFNRAGSPGTGTMVLDELGLPPDAVLLEVDSPPVSATSVRRNLVQVGSGGDILLPAVEAYIRERALYRE